MDLDNNDFKDREKHDYKLLTDINDNYDFDLFAKNQFELNSLWNSIQIKRLIISIIIIIKNERFQLKIKGFQLEMKGFP